VKKIDRQGLDLTHLVYLVNIEPGTDHTYGVFCTYKTPKLAGLLWLSYLGSGLGLLYAKSFTYMMSDHLDLAPLWAKYRSRTAEPIATYWQTQAEKTKRKLDQLQESDIIRRDPTEDPSGR
jgi:hypothetical protein